LVLLHRPRHHNPGEGQGILQRSLLASVFGLRTVKILESGITRCIPRAGHRFISPALIIDFQLIHAIARAPMQAVRAAKDELAYDDGTPADLNAAAITPD
jgi:hypothetical protein